MTPNAKSLSDLVAYYADAEPALKEMLSDGVALEPGSASSDFFLLVTSDPAIAEKYGMHEESEFLDISDDDVPSADDHA